MRPDPAVRPTFARRHGAFLLLLAVAAPAIVLFCRSATMASLADDSASYVILAQWLRGTMSPHVAAWLHVNAHFPPAFPALLALAGGDTSWERAHLVVAALAIAALVALYLYGRERGGGRAAAGIALVLVFLATPTAWIGIRGVLSEALFLLVTIAALYRFDTRLHDGDAPWREWLLFGALLAMATLTRTAGVALVAAYVAHAGWRLARGRGKLAAKLVTPLAMAAVAMLAWQWLRPAAGSDAYANAGAVLASGWLERPLMLLGFGSEALRDGWIAGFVAEGEVGSAPRIAFLAVALLAIIGSAGRALGNRLDGWYVLATLAMLTLWVFGPENMRRLLHPLVPVMLANAAWLLARVAARTRRERAGDVAVGLGAVLVVLLCLPATLLIAEKARDRAPLLAGGRYAAADITDYYRVRDVLYARALAAKHAAVMEGLLLLREATPADARILWHRPEYVALLGDRAGVPLRYAWDARRLAEEARRSDARYLLVTGLSKVDQDTRMGEARAVRALAAPYTTPVMAVPNAVTGAEEFVLLRIDRERLAAYLGG